MAGEFSAQRPVTRKMFPFDDVIMFKNLATSSMFAAVQVSIMRSSDSCFFLLKFDC